MFEAWFYNDDKSLAVLTSNDRCFVVYTGHGGPGLMATTPDHTWRGTPIQFLLENGQVDEHDVTDTISASQAMKVVEYFLAHGEPAPFVTWVEPGCVAQA